MSLAILSAKIAKNLLPNKFFAENHVPTAYIGTKRHFCAPSVSPFYAFHLATLHFRKLIISFLFNLT